MFENLFGYKLKRKNPEKEITSFATPESEDGAKMIDQMPGGDFSSMAYSFGADASQFKENENGLIDIYRNLSQEPEVDEAIENIINEAIVIDDDAEVVSLKIEHLVENGTIDEKIQKSINKEFEHVLKLMSFKHKGQEWFRRWYVDGKIYFHKMIDKEDTKNGIIELRYLDPKNVTKIKEIKRVTHEESGVELSVVADEYFIYYDVTSKEIVKSQFLAKVYSDAITHATSGLMSPQGDVVISYLHKAIRPMNMLKLIEDSMIIYRVTRAPQRRIFYVDVGELPKAKAESYLKNLANEYKNKLTYNQSTGEVDTKSNVMGLLEDFWLPRRDGSRGTEVSTLDGGGELGSSDDYDKIRAKVQKSLQVPVARLEADNPFALGRPSDMSREEIKFTRFIKKLRAKFSTIFDDILGTQLILKRIVTESEWELIKDDIIYMFNSDSFFTELKDNEILKERLEMLAEIEPYIGKYFPKEYIHDKILKTSDTDRAMYDKQIEDGEELEGEEEIETNDEENYAG